MLGPLLFLIYIHDLPSVFNLFMPSLFAGDTNLFCTGRNIDSLVNDINDEMSKVYPWVKTNKFSLNINNNIYTKMFFRTMGKILIDGHQISGVIIDNNLKWSAHIQYISRKNLKVLVLWSKKDRYLNKIP